jgi:hypothetical protein
MCINYLSNKSLFIDPHLFIFIIIHHFIMFETITYNNLKTLVHDLMMRLYDQYHQIWTWRIKIYYKDNKSKYNQLMKVMRTWNVKGNINTINSWKSWGQWNIKANINTINSWKLWGHWNIKGNINTIKERYMCSFRSFFLNSFLFNLISYVICILGSNLI